MALAWELPSKPPSEILEELQDKLNDGTLGLHRNDTINKIKYIDTNTSSNQKQTVPSFYTSPQPQTHTQNSYYTQPSKSWDKYSNKYANKNWETTNRWTYNNDGRIRPPMNYSYYENKYNNYGNNWNRKQDYQYDSYYKSPYRKPENQGQSSWTENGAQWWTKDTTPNR